ncbi:NAD(P)-binding protein [Aspergillus lucknowensis]|uniref:NAD(P)-binding protein n=1 Tax=Aspergillus lucknowensis TaxID=176173 RepID=A0ABR4LET5_9EURO
MPPNRYKEAHASPNGPGDSRPTALQIITDEKLHNALGDKVLVLTGATSGIGLETARALAATGARLFLTVRDLNKAKANNALSEIITENPDRIELVEMDNASLESVRRGADEILAASRGQVNVLIANAAVMGIKELELSKDGYEMHFATNYLGHFMLFQLLKPALLASASREFNSRVVVVSSSAQRVGNLAGGPNGTLFGYDYNFTEPEAPYVFSTAYANSKLASVYMANEIERRYASRNLHATSLHPGAIDTNISRHLGRGFVEAFYANEAVVRIIKSVEQGAATTVLAAVGREWEGRGGVYLEDCAEAQRGAEDGNPLGTGYVERTYDEVLEGKLWGMGVRLLGVDDD